MVTREPYIELSPADNSLNSLSRILDATSTKTMSILLGHCSCTGSVYFKAHHLHRVRLQAIPIIFEAVYASVDACYHVQSYTCACSAQVFAKA